LTIGLLLGIGMRGRKQNVRKSPFLWTTLVTRDVKEAIESRLHLEAIRPEGSHGHGESPLRLSLVFSLVLAAAKDHVLAQLQS
jgi:hypothetical protein